MSADQQKSLLDKAPPLPRSRCKEKRVCVIGSDGKEQEKTGRNQALLLLAKKRIDFFFIFGFRGDGQPIMGSALRGICLGEMGPGKYPTESRL